MANLPVEIPPRADLRALQNPSVRLISMPIVHREGPFRFRIWPADHEPPHVHVYNGDGMCIIEIETARLRKVSGMRGPDADDATVIVIHNRAKLLAEWRRIHGV